MREPRFSAWSRWEARGKLSDVGSPGIYVVAVHERDLSGESFSWLNSVVYVGMTNSVGGIASRLRQFDGTISGKRNLHGGADRFRLEHRSYSKLLPQLFVAIAPYPCDPSSNKPADLRIMGDVAKCELECLARFVEAHGHLPQFNDKKASPKYSLTLGRHRD
jgi:hypothetical protein